MCDCVWQRSIYFAFKIDSLLAQILTCVYHVVSKKQGRTAQLCNWYGNGRAFCLKIDSLMAQSFKRVCHVGSAFLRNFSSRKKGETVNCLQRVNSSEGRTKFSSLRSAQLDHVQPFYQTFKPQDQNFNSHLFPPALLL